jgi:hypothetical protein
MDGSVPRSRIYIVGCARSGTTLLRLMMTCFGGSFVLDREAHVGAFARITNEATAHIIQRRYNSHAYLHRIPEKIHLLFMVRHPFDVLSSARGNVTGYVSMTRWVAESKVLLDLLARRRTQLTVVRYEDLVTSPNRVQLILSEKLKLNVSSSFSTYHERARPNWATLEAIGSLRAPDTASVGRFLRDCSIAEQCRRKLRGYEELLEQVGRNFNYSVR